MALLRRLFYRKPPDRLLEISDRVFVFDCCFSKDVLREDEIKVYFSSTVNQLQDHFPDASFMVFNFGEGERRSQVSDILSHYGMTVMDYPRQYEGCPLLALEMIHHFLRSSESWLSLEGQHNMLLMHCERGGWPVLAFMLACLLLYRKQYSGEQKTLEMVYKQAPRELLHLLTPVNPQPSQLRYLQYITRRHRHSDWPPQCTPLILQSLIIRVLPLFHGETGLRPVVRVCSQNHSTTERNSKLMISTPHSKTHACHHRQAEHIPVIIDIHVPVQGDVVLECIHLDKDMLHEEIIFRIMFNTAFIQSNLLMLNCEDIDVVWGAKDRFPKDFKAEVLFLDFNAVGSTITRESVSGGNDDTDGAEEEFFEVEELFSNVDVQGGKGDADVCILQGSIPDGGNHILERRGISHISEVQYKTLDDVNDKSDPLLRSIHGGQVRENYKQDANVASSLLKLHGSIMDDQKHRMRTKEVISDVHRKFEGKSATNRCRHQESSDVKQDMALACQNNLGCKDDQQKMGTEVKSQHSGSLPVKNPVVTKHNVKQHDSDGSHTKMAETKTHWEPANKQSSSKTMQSLSHQPRKHASQPASMPIISVPTDRSSGDTLKSTRVVTNHISYEITDFPGDVLRPLPTLSIHTSEKCTSDSPWQPQGRCPLLSTSLQVNPPPLLRPQVVQQPLNFVQSPQLHSPFSPTKRTLQAQPPARPPQPPPLPPLPPPPPPPLPPTLCRRSQPPSLPHEENIQSTAPKVPLPPPLMTIVSSNCPKLGSTPPTLPKHGAPPPATPPHAPPLPPKNGTPPPPPPAACGKTPPPPPPACGKTPPAPPPPPQVRATGLHTESRPPGGAIPPPPPLSTKAMNKIGSNVGPRHSGGRGVSRHANLGHQGSLASANQRPSLKPLHWIKVTKAMRGSLWDELQKYGEHHQSASEFDVSELETLFSTALPNSANICSGGKSGGRRKSVGSKPEKIHLIDLRRSKNCEIMLTKIKMPFSDMMALVLALDESSLDIDQVENLIKNCPTKVEMELLKGYDGKEEDLGKCEQFFLEMMKVPRVESKLRVFSFKIQFGSQISDFRKSLNTINSTCNEVRNSIKLKEIMKKILCLGNTLNQGTTRGSAVGFRLDSLLKLTDTRASNNKTTLMHFLCKVLATKSPGLLNFHEDLVSLEAASKIQLKSLAEEMQVILKGLEKVKQELVASENDGPVSGVFRKTLKEFVIIAEAEVASLVSLYSIVGRNADSLSLYFGEDPARCPFEQVTSTLLNFVRMFRRAHEENCKQAEMERRKARKEDEMEKAKGLNQTRNIVK